MNRINPQNLATVSRLLMVAGCFVVLAATQLSTYAQEKTTLRRVEIIGLQHLSADQVIATTGLSVGDSVDARLIDAAAAKLMNTGWFKSVNYRVQTADSDTTVIFEVLEKATTSTGTTTNDVLGNVSWSGNRALTNQELTNAFGLHAGEAATRARIEQGLEAVFKAYARNGYINATFTETIVRDANRRVNYQFAVSEGQRYRMGALTITGVTPTDMRILKSKWTLVSTEIFDGSYLEEYQSTVIRPFVTTLTQRSGTRAKYEISMKPDTQKQTVDVIITFR